MELADLAGSDELCNDITVGHCRLPVVGREGGRLRSDRASVAKGFVSAGKPSLSRF